MTPIEKKEQLFKYFYDKLFKEGYPRESITKMATDFSLLVMEEMARPYSMDFINDVIHELKK